MYGIPNDFPYSTISGVQLIQVCFGENDLILNFSSNISILITSSISLEQSPFESEFVKLSVSLLRLLGQTISGANQSDDKKILSIDFSGGETLSILDDSFEYESYVVNIGDSKFVI